MKKILQTPSANIERLLQHGRFLDYITKRIKTYLPGDFSDNITVVRFDKKLLVIATSSSAWASKLRFFIPQLRRSLIAESRFTYLVTIKVKVSSQKISKPAPLNTPFYSHFAAKILHDNAEFINNDELKASLLNLSRHIAEKAKV
jgi:hypothetical protein